MRKSGGFGISVSDEQIMKAQRDIARDEGIFCEISSAVALAATSEAVYQGRIAKGETAAVILTGAGLKDYPLTADDISHVPLSENVSSLTTALGRILATERIGQPPKSRAPRGIA